MYRRIRAAILRGGVFLNTDAVSGPFWPSLRDEWAAFMARQGFTLEQGYQNLEIGLRKIRISPFTKSSGNGTGGF